MWRWLAILLLAGCSTTAAPDRYYNKRDIPAPSIGSFPSCRAYGCTKIDMVSLSKKEWRQIKKLFPAKSPEKERKAISKSIALFEKYVGAKT
ncbi:MAG: hypothetical protein KGQ41_04460, partial [Alphaproteobacteria bacterium]|nr:hypothetical protein [Alphaproteobacteria bacterium]